MARANKCDACDTFFDPQRGIVSMTQIQVMRGVTEKECDPVSDTWGSEDEPFDFCPTCSAKILEVIGNALQGLDETLSATTEEPVEQQQPEPSGKGGA